jgi:hypothetical protein
MIVSTGDVLSAVCYQTGGIPGGAEGGAKGYTVTIKLVPMSSIMA